MNPSTDPSQPTHYPGPGGSLAQLQQENQALRTLFEFTLVALIILSLSVGLFMYKQTRVVRFQLLEQRPFVGKLIADYQKNSEPLIRNFSMAMDRFAATNRDFQPIMEKYRPIFKDYLTFVPAAMPPAPPVPGSKPPTNK